MQALLSCLVSEPRRLCGMGWPLGTADARCQGDAIDWTGCDAEFTSRAGIDQYGVHGLESADNGIDGAGPDAQGASDASRLIDDHALTGFFLSMGRIERHVRHPCEFGESSNPGVTARWALVDVGLPLRDGLRVEAAGRITTARALRLGQDVVNGVG